MTNWKKYERDYQQIQAKGEKKGGSVPIASAIIGAVATVASTVASGAAQASAAGAANTAQMEMYEESKEYQERRDRTADRQWRKEFGLRERELKGNERNSRWQRRQAESQLQGMTIKDMGQRLTDMTSNNIQARNALWSMWGGRKK